MTDNVFDIGDLTIHQFVVDVGGLAAGGERGLDVRGKPMYLPQGFIHVDGFARTLDGDTVQQLGVGVAAPFDSDQHYVNSRVFTPAAPSFGFKLSNKFDRSILPEDFLVKVTNLGASPVAAGPVRLELNFYLRRLFS